MDILDDMGVSKLSAKVFTPLRQKLMKGLLVFVWLGHLSSLVWRNNNNVPLSLNLSSGNQVHSVPYFFPHLFEWLRSEQ